MAQREQWKRLGQFVLMPVRWTGWLLSRLMILVLKAYKVTISPLLGGCCRFTPSCSTYCIGALEKHGPLKGICLGAARLCKCHPFHRGGADPVPDSFTLFSLRKAIKR